MKNIYLLVVLILIYSAKVISSQTRTAFEKKYGGMDDDESVSVIETSDHNYVMAGTVRYYTPYGNWESFMAKVDRQGSLIWFKTYKAGYGSAVKETKDKGLALLCSGYLIKTDSLGNELWGNKFSEYGNDGGTRGNKLVISSDNNYFILKTSVGAANVFLMKIDSNGNTIWKNNYGQVGADFASSVDLTENGEPVLLYRNKKSYIVKTDNLGNIIWEKSSEYYLEELKKYRQGQFIAIGTDPLSNSGDMQFLIYDSDGNVLLDKKFGGVDQEGGHSISVTSDNGFVATGYTTSYGRGMKDVYIVRIDSMGNNVWDNYFGSSYDDIGYSIIQTTEGAYLIGGMSDSGYSDIYLIKTFAPSVLSLNIPFAGIKWQAGTHKKIEWIYSGKDTLSNIKIEFTSDNGLLWDLITDSVLISQRYYLWDVPQISSNNCKIRISSIVNPEYSSENDSTFSIFLPEIKLTYPSGGEVLHANYLYDIQWISNIEDSLSIEFTTDGGDNWLTISSVIAGVGGHFGWYVPNLSSKNCKIRLTDIKTPELSTQNNTNFEIMRGEPIDQYYFPYDIPGGSGYTYSACEVKDDGFAVAGEVQYYKPGTPVRKMLIYWIDDAGNILWEKIVDESMGRRILKTNDNGLLVSGTKFLGSSLQTAYILKLNSNGKILWEISSGISKYESCIAIDKTSDHFYYALIYDADSSYVLKINDLGVIQWRYKLSGTAIDMHTIEDDNCVVLFSKSSEYYFIKLSPEGQAGWINKMNIPSSRALNSFAVMDSTNFAVIGNSYCANLDMHGDQKWEYSFPNYKVDCYSVKKLPDNCVLVGGDRVPSDAYYPPVLLKLNSNGELIDEASICSSTEHILDCLVTADSSIFIAGFSTWSIGVDIFLAKTRIVKTGIQRQPDGLELKYMLSQNYPNPFNPTTMIKYSIPKAGFVTINIFNSLGQEITKLISQYMSAGTYTTEWNASGLASGVYFYRIHAGNYMETRKLLFLK